MILSYTAGGSLVYVEFDATVREEHASATTVTEYHVERGANVADHARPEADKVTVDCVVTNTPIVAPRTNNQGKKGLMGVTVIVPTITTIPKVLPGIGAIASMIPQGTETVRFQALDFDGEFDRVRSVYDELRFLMSKTILVNLSSGLRDYTNMVLRTLTTPRTSADSVTFTFSATEVRFVDSEIVGVVATTRAPVAVVSKGPQTAVETEPQTKRDVFKQIAAFYKGFKNSGRTPALWQ